MMRKKIKTGLIAFGMCLALPFCSFAAVKNPEKAEGREERAQIRTELASYREGLDSNTKELMQAGDADGAKADLEEKGLGDHVIVLNEPWQRQLTHWA